MHQYQLQKYEGIHSRYRCPQCQSRRKTLTLYINTQTNEPLSTTVGKCDRVAKCGYHYTPKQWFGDQGLSVVRYQLPVTHQKPKTDNRELTTGTIDHGLFKRSLKAYHHNHLVTFLIGLFGADITQGLINRYLIGTAKHWPGATVFWQIAADGGVRTGKIMLYNPVNGKRVKQPFNHIAWVHKVLERCETKEQRAKTKDSSKSEKSLLLDPCSFIPTDFKLEQCLFGEHLLPGNSLPVALVESEKTALIASVYLPAYIWLATGSLTNLTAQKCGVLKDRQVYLFPDLNGYEAWLVKAAGLRTIARFTVHQMLEHKAATGEKQQGFDIADYLMG